MHRRVLMAIAATLVILAAACGDDGGSNTATDAAPPEATASSEVSAERSDAQMLDLVGCERIGMATPVDAVSAEALVPADLEVRATPDGQAMFALQHLSCRDLMTDGTSHGAGGFATAWIGITGTGEPPTLPADAGLEPAPTDYFHPVLFQTDNEGFAAATADFGIPMSLADEMVLDPTVEGTQTASAANTDLEPPLSYGLTIENANRSDEGPPPAVHTLFGVDDEGELLTYYGTFTHQPGFLGNPATMTLEPGSAWAALLDTGFSGVGNGTEIDVSMIVFREGAIT